MGHLHLRHNDVLEMVLKMAINSYGNSATLVNFNKLTTEVCQRLRLSK